VEKLKECILPYKNIKDWNEQLADVLKEEKNVEKYVDHVNAHIDIFREQQRQAKDNEG
jgi:ABC-type Fe3+-hydroxamate transport system substrate-binding protein